MHDEPPSPEERIVDELDALWHKLDKLEPVLDTFFVSRVEPLLERIDKHFVNRVEPLLERIATAAEKGRVRPPFPRPEDVCSQDDSTSWDGTFRTILESGWSEKQKADGKEWTAGNMRLDVAEKIRVRLEACGWSVQIAPSEGPDGRPSAITFRVKPRP